MQPLEKPADLEGATIPRLPDEVVRHIVHYLHLEELLQMRLTSKQWNQYLTTYLRKSPLPIIRFYHGQEDYLNSFLLTFQTRLTTDVAFGTFHLTLGNVQKIRSFLSVIGSRIRNCTIRIEDKVAVSLQSLAELMPNLKKLSVGGRNFKSTQFYEISSSPNTTLPILQTLKFGVGVYEIIMFDVLEGWVSTLGALKHLFVTVTMSMQSQLQLHKFLHQYSNLETVDIVIKFEEEELIDSEKIPSSFSKKLSIWMEVINQNTNFLSNVVANLAGALVSFMYELDEGKRQVDCSGLSHLHSLYVIADTDEKLDRFLDYNSSVKFQALTDLTLDCRLFNYETMKIHFSRINYPTVKSLDIYCGFDSFGTPVKPYHLIFPNLTQVCIEGKIVKGHIEYICQYLPKIVHLTLKSSSKDSQLHNVLFMDGVSQNSAKPSTPKIENTFKWALSPLTGLKFLSINDVTNIRKIIVGVAALTSLGRFPPIKYLCFVGDVRSSEEKFLFRNYQHGKVVFTHEK